ncbi:DUF6265 family protein [Flavihumibacter sp. RY-1]|uniref:DUF6265 family protein n=1 Tax=Flavihumibacter fluminis TaxID=2909236 RepID=A0ABS9BIE5_9BACT|nr:DUF6265 family protein [Flavihumibacter fluminis]MCF1715484.1 DUF6265 family protein [Flavihumibacter fluminis]
MNLHSILLLTFFFKLDADPFDQLKQLEGCWQRTGTSVPEFEEWKIRDSFSMVGRMYKVKEGDTMVSEEILLIKKQQQVFYQAKTFNQPEQERVSFRLTGYQNGSYVFENPKHDYPRRIVYSFKGLDSLHAWIDAGDSKASTRVDFHFKRVK